MEEKKEKKRRLSKRIIALIVAAAFIAVLGFTALGFFIGYWAADASAYIWTPSYEKLDESRLREIYFKQELNDEDYQILFEQTGLTKLGIQRAKANPTGWARVLRIQESYFTKRGIVHQEYVPLVCTDLIDGQNAENIFLERGDIIITSSTHFSGFRIGHSAIVTNGPAEIVFQANQVGTANGYSSVGKMFDNRINFMVLRIKPEYFSENKVDDESYRDNLNRATYFIEHELYDIPYSVFTGVFTQKDSTAATSCSHLLWYGFNHFDDANGGKFNLDLDSNGRLLVVPKDISRSPYVELVQTFGFDPDKMYE